MSADNAIYVREIEGKHFVALIHSLYYGEMLNKEIDEEVLKYTKAEGFDSQKAALNYAEKLEEELQDRIVIEYGIWVLRPRSQALDDEIAQRRTNRADLPDQPFDS